MAREYVDEGIPFLRSQDIQPFRIDWGDVKFITPEFNRRLKKSELGPGDLVVVRTGYPGTAAVIPKSVGKSNCADLVIIRPGDAVDSRYLSCVFNSTWGKRAVGGSLVGVAQQHFNVSAARDMEILLPPPRLQRRIVSILSAYDDLVENSLRRIKTLEEMAQSLYKEWFVDFRFPRHESVETVGAALGMIPEGWEAKDLFSVASVTYGKPFKSSLFNSLGEGKPVIRIRDIPTLHSNTFTIEEADPRYVVDNGDLLIGMDGDFHMGMWAGGSALLNQRVALLRPKKPVSTAFLYLALSQPIADLNSAITGTTVAHLLDSHLRGIWLTIPPAGLAQELCNPLDDLATEGLRLKLANQVLKETRDLLLPKLISGEIDVSDLDIDVGEDAA